MSELRHVGRKRTPAEEKKSNVWVRLTNPVIWELEKEGILKDVLERIIMAYYLSDGTGSKEAGSSSI